MNVDRSATSTRPARTVGRHR